MIYGILGDLEVRDQHGALVELPRGHALGVLAALLLRPGRQLSTTDLRRAGWGHADVNVAQLHKVIAKLRTLLGPGAITTFPDRGYEFQAAEDDHDMLKFLRLIERADAEHGSGNTAAEIVLLRAALDLWRGPVPLANVALGAYEGEIEALRGRRKRIAVRLFTRELARGEHAAVLDDLVAFRTEYPADAQLSRLLMIALYLNGHADDALAECARYEDESGGADLRTLGYAMANRDDEAVATAAGLKEQPRPGPLPRQLPPAPPFFVGRDGLLKEVTWLLRSPRMGVLVISGPGGMGKTALALRAAHDAADVYPAGQLWADLRGTTEQPADPAEVLAGFLRGLGETVVPDSRGERAALFRSLLADRRLLIVLDDAAGAAQIRDLLPGGGQSVVLVTARRRLPDVEAAAHQVAPLGALGDTIASQLFRQIVAGGHVDLTGEDEAVAEVVRLCGGLPLALRIAALLRVEGQHRPTAELVRRLKEQGPTAFSYGNESLARTLGAGLKPLDNNAKRLFLGLGLLSLPTFAGWTAAALLDQGDPDAALTQLAAVGMLELAPPGVRYRFHDLTREYAHALALAELEPAEERTAAPARVCRALLTLTRHAHSSLYGGQFDVVHSDVPDVAVPKTELDEAAAEPRAWFERERLDIRAAVEQAAALGETQVCWDLAVSAHEFYALGDYFDDWRTTHMIALEACRAAGDRRGEGMVLTSLGQPPLVASGAAGVSGVAELETAISLLAEAGEAHGQAMARRTLANALRRAGELRRPLGLFREARDRYEESGDVVGVQQALRFIAQTHLDLGEFDEAGRVLGEAERVARELGQARVLAPTLYWKGQAHLAAGDIPAAGVAFDEVLALAPEGNNGGLAYALHGLGDLALATHDFDTAQERLDRADGYAQAGADGPLAGRIELSIAALQAARGWRAEQVVALLRAVTAFQSCGALHLEIEAQAALAGVYAELGDADAAEAARDRVSELYGSVPPEDRRH